MKKLSKNSIATFARDNRGFTFIEILIAIAIFVLAVLAAVNIATGSVKATQDAKDTTMATWLLQQKMVELETQLENKGIELGLTTENIREPFLWTTMINLSANRNEVTKLYKGQPIDNLGRGGNSIIEGEPIGVFYN